MVDFYVEKPYKVGIMSTWNVSNENAENEKKINAQGCKVYGYGWAVWERLKDKNQQRVRVRLLHSHLNYFTMNQFKIGIALTMVVSVALCGVIIIASLIEVSTAFAWIVIILGAVRFFNLKK